MSRCALVREGKTYALGHLGERISRIEDRGQLVRVRSTLNYSLNLYRLSIGPDYPICVQQHLPMLALRVGLWINGNWDFWLRRNVFHPGDDLADGNVPGVHFRGIIRAPKEDRKNVRRGNVLLEYAIDYRIALCLIIE